MPKNKKKPESKKSDRVVKEAVKQVEANYLVSRLEDGTWKPEDEPRVSLGRRALVKGLSEDFKRRPFKVRKVAV